MGKMLKLGEATEIKLEKNHQPSPKRVHRSMKTTCREKEQKEKKKTTPKHARKETPTEPIKHHPIYR